MGPSCHGPLGLNCPYPSSILDISPVQWDGAAPREVPFYSAFAFGLHFKATWQTFTGKHDSR